MLLATGAWWLNLAEFGLDLGSMEVILAHACICGDTSFVIHP